MPVLRELLEGGAGLPDPAPIHIRRNAGSSTKGVAAAKLAKPQTRVSSTRGNFSD